MAKLDTKKKQKVVELLALGATVTKAARAVKVSRQLVYLEMHRDPGFGKRCEKARE